MIAILLPWINYTLETNYSGGAVMARVGPWVRLRVEIGPN